MSTLDEIKQEKRKPVDVYILGNGASIDCWAMVSRKSMPSTVAAENTLKNWLSKKAFIPNLPTRIAKRTVSKTKKNLIVIFSVILDNEV